MNFINFKRLNLGVSLKKMKVISDIVNGKSVEYALLILSTSAHRSKSVLILNKSINSAFNQLKGSFETDFSPAFCFVNVMVNKGTTQPRKIFHRAKGRANFTVKNSCHLMISIKYLERNNNNV